MPPTTAYSLGDVVLVPFPFTNQAGLKKRPAVSPAAKSRKKKPEIDDKALGRRLHDLRLRQGMTQAELAAKVGLKQPTLSLYERGDVP